MMPHSSSASVRLMMAGRCEVANWLCAESHAQTHTPPPPLAAADAGVVFQTQVCADEG